MRDIMQKNGLILDAYCRKLYLTLSTQVWSR